MKMRWHVLFVLFVFALSGQVGAAEEAYNLGPGDRIQVAVYGQEDLETEAELGANGTIHMPLLGPVHIAGLSAPEAADRIARGLEVGGYLQDAHVNLLVTEYNSKSISVLGQVNKPGQIVLKGPTTLTEALAMAGGISERGSERIVLVRVGSDGKQSRRELQLRELLDSEAENRAAVKLQKGDTLYVPLIDQFYVHGQVQKPGTYSLDRPLNVMQALSVSGGLNARANNDGLILYRQQDDGSLREQDADLYDPIQDGDVLFVKESLF
ncbi:SLBB domain-containing protein [Marinobacter fonticola]|uniref:SLBB domain-containing protein n=1 Tax=Marinobacter fonticola TaxID=2603215 RepID=UPI0011E7BE03|nr:SLBB domain-containing protein [Marinobacter fonticola]